MLLKNFTQRRWAWAQHLHCLDRMTQFYLACEFGRDAGRVSIGSLHHEQLTVSEVHQFDHTPIRSKSGLQWDVNGLYNALTEALRAAGVYEEPIGGISCTSCAGDYLLFDAKGALLTPALIGSDPRFAAKSKNESGIRAQNNYFQIGIQPQACGTPVQLAQETSKRLKRAACLLPLADGFNYLLCGVPRIEATLASATELYQPVERTWSERLLEELRVPRGKFAEVVPSGTVLGKLLPQIASGTKLDEAKVIASCSHDLAAMAAGMPANPGEGWAFLGAGTDTSIGVPLAEPLINDLSRDLRYSNHLGYGSSIVFHKTIRGLSILEACQRFWEKENRQLDPELLMHLAGSATPFESLINPADPRFDDPEEMPLKIQAFCRETEQILPRKPGPIFRCILESLALYYRRMLLELEHLSGVRVARLFLTGDSTNSLLNHFIANALQLPVVVLPKNITAIGNVAVQAVALGHLENVMHAREVVRNSFRLETLLPHGEAWNGAYQRFFALAERAEIQNASPAAAA